MIGFHLYVSSFIFLLEKNFIIRKIFDCLAKQDSYELVQLNTNDEHHVRANQLPRFKISATDGMYGLSFLQV